MVNLLSVWPFHQWELGPVQSIFESLALLTVGTSTEWERQSYCILHPELVDKFLYTIQQDPQHRQAATKKVPLFTATGRFWIFQAPWLGNPSPWTTNHGSYPDVLLAAGVSPTDYVGTDSECFPMYAILFPHDADVSSYTIPFWRMVSGSRSNGGLVEMTSPEQPRHLDALCRSV
jgi:hypothetical protein